MFREGENTQEGQGNRKRRKKEEKMVSHEGAFSLAACEAAGSFVEGQMKSSLTISITVVQEM